MNYKNIGQIGENCVLGDLSKYGLDIAIPLSDNLPYDLIVIAGNKLYKVQIKTSSNNHNEEWVSFGICSNNWLQGTTKKYTKEDCDIIICYDLVKHKSFLLLPYNFENKGSFTIRYKTSKNNQQKVNWYEDYIISEKRVKEVFDFDVPNFKLYFAKEKKKYKRICLECGEEFEGNYRRAKYCSAKCKNLQRRKVERPSKEELKQLIDTTSFLQIGRQFKVSDNAIRKWAKSYELI